MLLFVHEAYMSNVINFVLFMARGQEKRKQTNFGANRTYHSSLSAFVKMGTNWEKRGSYQCSNYLELWYE